MSMKEDIVRILGEYRDTIHDGNTDRAAKALNVNTPTLWRWLKGENIPKVASISRVFDTLNAKIVLPGELPPGVPQDQKDQTQKMETLQKDIEHLRRENELLQKLVSKYEHDEREKNEAPEK